MNKLPHFNALGMPWHGLASAGVLTTPAGNKAITGNGGAVVVRHPSAPGATRNTAQQARDTALGHVWRDYALLCGTTRAVNGRASLGGKAWLYCAPDGRTWVMTVEKTYTSGSSATFEIWRRELFGNFKADGPWSTTDEKVGEQVINFTLPAEYSGSTTAADVAANAHCNLATLIVPDPAGSTVYLHIATTFYDVYEATYAVYEGGLRSVYAICEVSISGSGDVAASGTGISATFDVVDDYDALITYRSADLTYGASAPSDWNDYTTESVIEDHPTPPLSAGITYDQTDTCTPDSSTSYYWQHGPVTSWRKAVIYRTHIGDVTLTRHDYYVQHDAWVHNGGTWQAIYHYESVSDGGGGFYYELQGTDYTADLSYSEYTYQQGEKLIEVDCGGTVTVGENAYVRTAYTHYYNAPTGTGGGWCSSYPNTIPDDVAYAEDFVFSGGALSGGQTYAGLDLSGAVSIWPGIVIASVAYDAPNNDGTRHYEYAFIGVGETNFVQFASYSFNYNAGVQPPPTTYVPFKWAFQPVDGVGVYGLNVTAPTKQYC